MTGADIKSRKTAANDTPPPATLWEAFAAAQAEFGPIIKSTKGARGNYAPLDSVLEAVRPIINKHALALTQATFVSDGTLFVRSSIVHTPTGEHHDAEYPAGLFTLQHQQLGAGVTYARRYSLLSLLGVFPENEDDDGEKAGAAGPPPRRTNVVTNPTTGKKIDTESANQQRKNGAWERFTDRVQGYIEARDIDGLKQWFNSEETAEYVAGWVFKDQANDHFDAAVEHIEKMERAR